MDDRFNTAAGWVLAAGIVALGSSIVSGMYFHADSAEHPEEPGYFIEGAAEEGGADAGPDLGTLLASADAAAGEKVFAKCTACHTIDQGGANGIGPNLYGVVGRAVAGHAGFAYSDAMVAHKAEDPTWSLDALDQFITAPARYVSGTKMSFAGLRDTETRVNLIAWMMTQGSSGYAVPAPDPARQPGAAAGEPGEAGEGEAAAPIDGAAGQPVVEETPAAPPASDSAPVGG